MQLVRSHLLWVLVALGKVLGGQAQRSTREDPVKAHTRAKTSASRDRMAIRRTNAGTTQVRPSLAITIRKSFCKAASAVVLLILCGAKERGLSGT